MLRAMCLNDLYDSGYNPSTIRSGSLMFGERVAKDIAEKSQRKNFADAIKTAS